MKTLFDSLTDEQRFSLRCDIERLGAMIEGYRDGSFQVSIPREGINDFRASMRKLGLRLVPGSGHLFPLGTDNPPDNLRHDGSYPSSRAFWRNERWEPVSFSVGDRVHASAGPILRFDFIDEIQQLANGTRYWLRNGGCFDQSELDHA